MAQQIGALKDLADGRAFDQLSSILRHKDWWLRRDAAEALAAIRDPRVKKTLTPLLKDREPGVRRAVEPVLRRLETQEG